MIDDLDRSLRNLLAKELPEVQRGDVDVAFNQPDSELSSRLGNKPTLNLFLYDIRENAPLRQQQWHQVENGSPGSEHKVLLKRTPLRMDCFYLVTAWSPADAHTRPFEEHRLLTQAMLALARHPLLNLDPQEQFAEGRRPYAPVLKNSNGNGNGNGNGNSNGNGNGYLVGQLADYEYEVRTRIANHDVMTNPAELWSALENRIRAAFSYVVNLALDPWANQLQEAGEVGTVLINSGQGRPPAAANPEEEANPLNEAVRANKLGRSDDESASTTLINIGGIVRDQTKQMQPVASVKVTILEPDLYRGTKNIGVFKEASTDENGRFRFRRLPPGDFVVVVGADIGNPLLTKEITVSGAVDAASGPRDSYVDLVIGASAKPGKATKTRQK